MKALLHQFDYRLTTAIQQWPVWVRPLMVLVTFIGQPIFTVGIGIVVAALGWNDGNMRLLYSGFIIIATFGIGTLTKLLLRRDRPVTEYVANMWFETFSLPSGHSVGAVVSYGFLAFICLGLQPQWHGYIVSGILSVLVILIGLSRIYLGAHFPSDVVAGWLLGGAGLAIIIFIIQEAQL